MGAYDNVIYQTALQYGVPPELAKRVIQVESSHNPNAQSGKGAMGLAQLMPGTAKRLGVTDPYDPVQSITGGVKELRRLLDLYGGDERLALAGYNAGEGAVSSYGGKIPPYPETMDYIAKITGEPLDPALVAARHDGKPVDVRMAALQMPPGTPTGNPMTGMSLPPDLGLAYDPTELSRRLAQTGAPPETDGFMADPFLHVGLGILANSNNQNALSGIATGVQQGLATYQGVKDTDAKRRSKELDQFLYGSQLAQGWASQARNRGELTAFQQTQKMRWEQPGELQTYIDPTTGETYTGYQDPATGQFISGGKPLDISRMAPITNMNPGSGKKKGEGAAGPLPEGAEPGWALPLIQMQSLEQKFQDKPGAARALGTFGNLGADASALGGLVDTASEAFFGTSPGLKKWVQDKGFEGEDPAQIQATLNTFTLPIARAMVEPKGPLSGAEQAQAKRLIGIIESGGVSDEKTSRAILNETRRIFTLVTIGNARAAGEEIPPKWLEEEMRAKNASSFLDGGTLPPGAGESMGAMPPSVRNPVAGAVKGPDGTWTINGKPVKTR